MKQLREDPVGSSPFDVIQNFEQSNARLGHALPNIGIDNLGGAPLSGSRNF
jgi:hypothetical protein